jgi:hypothetical protein
MDLGKTPLHDAEGKLHFPYRALESKAFILPTPPPTSLGKVGDIDLLIPEEWRHLYQDGTGTILSIGPGYYDKKNGWHPTDPRLKPGTRVYYDTTVPWGIYVLGLDGLQYKVSICVEADILGIVEDE